MRRDVERQRRKEMGGLYKSLVTLIPYDYIKGKRSTSDRLQETVRYVRDLRKRVEKMRARRDELRGTVITEPVAVTTITSSSSSSSLLMKQKGDLHQDECRHDGNDDEMMSRVVVKPCRSGVEITLSVNKADDVSLSKILNVLVCQGMSVNTCSSVKLNHRLLLTIQAEVVGERTVDPTQVEQQLSAAFPAVTAIAASSSSSSSSLKPSTCYLHPSRSFRFGSVSCSNPVLGSAGLGFSNPRCSLFPVQMDAPSSDQSLPSLQEGTILPELLTEFMVEMSCEGCVKSVKTKLEGIEGVKSVDVDLGNQVVKVLGSLPVKTLAEALEQTGRKARLIGQGVPEGLQTMT
ncbi:unnamed protein product [Cuscuta campestris]|uniref:BHLH domain-containing protein n=1 Tax=Cuscuta campestris TaxID=132261 RepID=A0A484L3J0_9ASTE|nr:unnamed protein product [Cuscuta campestris]